MEAVLGLSHIGAGLVFALGLLIGCGVSYGQWRRFERRWEPFLLHFTVPFDRRFPSPLAVSFWRSCGHLLKRDEKIKQ